MIRSCAEDIIRAVLTADVRESRIGHNDSLVSQLAVVWHSPQGMERVGVVQVTASYTAACMDRFAQLIAIKSPSRGYVLNEQIRRGYRAVLRRIKRSPRHILMTLVSLRPTWNRGSSIIYKCEMDSRRQIIKSSACRSLGSRSSKH